MHLEIGEYKELVQRFDWDLDGNNPCGNSGGQWFYIYKDARFYLALKVNMPFKTIQKFLEPFISVWRSLWPRLEKYADIGRSFSGKIAQTWN